MNHQKLINSLYLNSFKYKVSLLGNRIVADNIAKRSVKVVVPLKYLRNFY